MNNYRRDGRAAFHCQGRLAFSLLAGLKRQCVAVLCNQPPPDKLQFKRERYGKTITSNPQRYKNLLVGLASGIFVLEKFMRTIIYLKHRKEAGMS